MDFDPEITSFLLSFKFQRDCQGHLSINHSVLTRYSTTTFTLKSLKLTQILKSEDASHPSFS